MPPSSTPLYAYGEDALTLWALTHRLDQILSELGDDSPPDACRIYYRPSFGRRGGPNRAEFGEFDAIIMARQALYLVESKWCPAGKKPSRHALRLAPHQIERHVIFGQYVEQWLALRPRVWAGFTATASLTLSDGTSKNVASAGSLLARSLETMLSAIAERYSACPPVHNVLIYFHHAVPADKLPRPHNGFRVVYMNYAEIARGPFVCC